MRTVGTLLQNMAHPVANISLQNHIRNFGHRK